MSNETSKATKRPWTGEDAMEVGSATTRPRVYGPSERIAGDVVEQLVCVCDSQGLYHRGATASDMDEEARANRDLIVQAVNSFDAMRAAYERIQRECAELAEKLLADVPPGHVAYISKKSASKWVCELGNYASAALALADIPADHPGWDRLLDDVRRVTP